MALVQQGSARFSLYVAELIMCFLAVTTCASWQLLEESICAFREDPGRILGLGVRP